MLLLISILLVVGAGFIVKFRERLAFVRGRAMRQRNRTSTSEALTQMGTDQFIELSFGRVHYIYRPASIKSSTLNIFVHGFSIPMQIWGDVFQSLANDDRPCLVFDLYGRGWSDAPDVPMNVDLFVSQLAELLYALNLPYEKYNLFGVSMGGVIVQRFTQLYPSKVSKLVLCCSAGLNVVKPPKILMFILSLPVLGPFLFKAVMQRPENKSVRAQWAYPDQEKYREYAQLFHRACQEHPGFLRALFSTIQVFDFHSMTNSAESIAKLNLPTLIIWGDKDSLIPVENAYRYHQFYKQATLCVVQGANHSILVEHSKEAIAAIRTFLKEK